MSKLASPIPFNIFRFQRRALPILLGWSLGSILVGLFWLREEDRFLRGIGTQFVGWGLIDGLIALVGLQRATADEARLLSGEISPSTHQEKARGFERFVWLNAFLDIGYVLGGSWLACRFSDKPHRRGIGLGIIFQGAFLFIWDVILALLVRGRQT